ncbi:MDR family MFS transporter [Spirilliplanes yamanashiensis]|uniref:MFS transporter n=1 Tax=Spirilliplanes yamanashiensis TaxID=42233 RepID=A0A8J3Y2X8_9ACTN|nr:MFS transporter [Spirilliplanes yamanashiensis]MDP9814340.1 MFS family permease [Spirilliplanes yamanashiensis]GIJ00678.1 MFS transporter [Spirilliplanes yamanashiensis]
MRGWLRRTTGGLPATFWYLWTGTLVNRLGAFVLVFLAIYLTQERGFSQSRAGLVIGLWGVGGAVGTLAGGVLADRWGRRPTLLTAHLGTVTMMLAVGLARDFWALAAGALLLGMFAEGARPAFGAMMVDVVPERDRVRAFSLNYWAINLGFAFSAVLAGLVAEVDYLLLFAIDAGTTLVTAVIVFLRVPETRPAAAPRTGRGPGLGAVLRDRVYLIFLALNLLGALMIMQHLSTLPIAMSADGLSPATFGLVIALNGVLIVSGQLFVPRLIEGRDRSRVLALASVIMAAGFALTAAADVVWVFAVSVLIWTVGEMLQSPSNSALIAELSPSALRGRYQGTLSLTWSAAAALAPVLGGATQEHLGDTVLWLGVGAVGVLVAAGQLGSGPSRERRAAALRAAERAATPAVRPEPAPLPPPEPAEQAVDPAPAVERT